MFHRTTNDNNLHYKVKHKDFNENKQKQSEMTELFSSNNFQFLIDSWNFLIAN